MAHTTAPNTRSTAEKESQNPKRWQCGDPSKHQHSPKHAHDDGKPLEKLYKWMKDYDKGMCDAWRDEIEKLLIFAGLFAATVTPFLVDSYKWLQEDNATASTKLLAQISLQLAAMASNSTPPALSLPDSSPFIPLSRNVRINSAWFLSLIMCLSTVILGILCLQWLREYARETSLANFDAITVRHIRCEGLFYWKVPVLISWLPIALQGSVLLFFWGILDLLWSLHPTVAAIAIIAVGLVAAALVFTTLAPVIQSVRYFHQPALHITMKQCPYKSPFSWLILSIYLFVGKYSGKRWFSFVSSWVDFDILWGHCQALIYEGKDRFDVHGFARALRWTIEKLAPAGTQSEIISEIFHSLYVESDIPRHLSLETLHSWAAATGDHLKNNKAKLAWSLAKDKEDPIMQYDLLMAWFLQRHSSVYNYDDFRMELCLRCLNTLIDREISRVPELFVTLFEEVLQEYEDIRTSSDKEDAIRSELRIQFIATILEYHSRNLPVEPSNIDHIGEILAEYIRSTLVKADNADMCYKILKWFEGYLDDIPQAQQSNRYRPQITVSRLRDLDLRTVEEWEVDITSITGNTISLSTKLNSFLAQQN